MGVKLILGLAGGVAVLGSIGAIAYKLYSDGFKAGERRVVEKIEKHAKKAKAQSTLLHQKYNLKNAKRAHTDDPKERAKGLMEDVSK